jgi:Arc/MetJ-type ribon-helix-helix transcriptional regulator
MGTKRRAVISAEAAVIDDVERLVQAKRYRTVSEFVGQALVEKLERERASALAEEVARYVATHAESSDDEAVLARAQALPGVLRRATRAASRTPASVRHAKR